MTTGTKIGVAVLTALIGVALCGPLIVATPFDAIDLPGRLTGPGGAHWFGRDALGRDIFTRVLYGARLSLFVGLTVTSISLSVGTLVGMIAGWSSALLDGVIMRVIDILQAFPGILLAIALTAVLGPGVENVVFALSVLGWVGFARVARGQTLAEKEKEYVTASRSTGAGSSRVLLRHVLPNVAGPLLVQATFGLGGVMIAEASLSFLGLGVQNYPSWGAMVNDGTEYLLTAPHIALFPGLALAVSVLGLNLLGDGLRDRLDPHQTSRRA